METRLAVVTGASSGIGLELAKQLSRKGHPVLAVARRIDRLEALAADAQASGAAPIHPMSVDIIEPDAAERILSRAHQLGGADWLVNNAGIMLPGDFAAQPIANNVRQLRLNCEALMALSAAFLPQMVSRKQGRILNIASLSSFQAMPFMAVYGATKAFVLSFSEALAEELRGTGVTVTALCPGPVTTELFDVSAPGVPRKKVNGELSAEACARAGLEAAERGVVVAVPGAANTVKSWGSKLFPRALVRRTLGNVGLKTLGLPRKGISE